MQTLLLQGWEPAQDYSYPDVEFARHKNYIDSLQHICHKMAGRDTAPEIA